MLEIRRSSELYIDLGISKRTTNYVILFALLIKIGALTHTLTYISEYILF